MRKTYLVVVLAALCATGVMAQTAATTDTVRSAKKTNAGHSGEAATTAAEGDQEIDLEAIEIQAVIEKPNVDIISKRSKPEWEETRFIDRSFETELKQAPKDLMLVDDELDRAQKLDALKKAEPPKKK